MWDGRETVQKLLPTNTPERNLAALRADLARQSNDATRGHAQAVRDLTDAERTAIVDFDLGVFTSQIVDRAAGDLTRLRRAGRPREPVPAAVLRRHQRPDRG
jgi:cytochrome c peroxidase